MPRLNTAACNSPTWGGGGGWVMVQGYGLINYKDNSRLYWRSLWTIKSVMLVFSIPLVNCWPSTFSDLPHPSPFSRCQRTVYTDSAVCGCGGGVLSCVVDHIMQEFNTLFLTRFRTYKIATPIQTKHQQRQHLVIGVFIVPLSLVQGHAVDDITAWQGQLGKKSFRRAMMVHHHMVLNSQSVYYMLYRTVPAMKKT